MAFSAHSPNWYLGTTLAERLESPPISTKDRLDSINQAKAQQRKEQWLETPPFDNEPTIWPQRLAQDDMNELFFETLLAETAADLYKRLEEPAWLTSLTQALSLPVEPTPIPDNLAKNEATGFLNLVEPIASWGRGKVRQGIQAMQKQVPHLPFAPENVVALLWENVPQRLLLMVSRTLVLELHVARLQGLLQGENAQDRFRHFCKRLRQPEIRLAILEEYPVLVRQLVVTIAHWANFSLEFLNHLASDWEAICATFSPDQAPGELVKLQGNAGDTHKNGRSVVIAEFSSGFKIVYKPKSLAVDHHFQLLLTWLNERGAQPPFRTLQYLDRESYGWVEFVANHSCTTEAEVVRFYQRQGSYLALLLMLSACDFHHENIIAAGEHPVPIDLEALFHPQIVGKDSGGAVQAASDVIADSVMRIGLLPVRILAQGPLAGVDISGLGGAGGQLSPFEVPLWDESGTDQMQLARRRVKMPGSENRPTLNGVEVDVLDYSEAVITGFTTMYQLLWRHREALLADGGPLSWFANDEVRVIVRATRTYAVLFRESFHPDVLRDGLDRERLFDRLWAQVIYEPYLAKLIAAERSDLHQGDIPFFTTRPQAQAIWNSHGQIVPNFFALSGLARVRRRLEGFNEADLEKQLWFIRAALGSSAKKPEPSLGQQRRQLSHQDEAAAPEKLLLVATAIGDELTTSSLAAGDEVTWLGVTLGANDNWDVASLGLDLYDGLPGVTLFLAYLGAVTQQKRFIRLAEKTATTWRRQIENHLDSLSAIGGFSGRGGLIYALTHLGVLWQRPALLVEAEVLAQSLPDLIPKDEYLDIIGGAAGCIGALLTLYRQAPSDNVLKVAIQCGDYLLDQALPQRNGVGWRGTALDEKCLSGFSHGAAGIAWALLELSAVSGEERFRQTALAAIEYERTLFVPEMGNWLDLREYTRSASGEPSFMLAWCHGAPGIGLARLQTLSLLDDAQIRAEIETAVHTTLANGFGNNHSLCHGDLGNLELLLQASQRLKESDILIDVYRLAGQILSQGEQNGWLCGTPLRVESPGLMTGLAGIGYGLLRLAAPTQVPAVLTMAPPISANRSN